jgi:hypothetical protein
MPIRISAFNRFKVGIKVESLNNFSSSGVFNSLKNEMIGLALEDEMKLMNNATVKMNLLIVDLIKGEPAQM